MRKERFERVLAKAPSWMFFKPVAGIETPHGKILIGESHRSGDPEFPGPHVQHIYAVERSGRIDPLVQKLFYGFENPANRDPEQRIRCTAQVATQWIEDSIASGRLS